MNIYPEEREVYNGSAQSHYLNSKKWTIATFLKTRLQWNQVFRTANKTHITNITTTKKTVKRRQPSAYPLKLEVACQDGPLVGVYALAACEELGHEAGVEGIKVNGGHVVDSQRDLLLQQVMAFVEQHLQQHVDEVEQHGCPEQLLENKTGWQQKVVFNGPDQ